MIKIDLRSRIPIYKQIIISFKQLIFSGIMEPGEKLPSVRELSSEMTVNPNTIQKAYKELERENIVYTLRGQGTFVNNSIKVINREERIKKLKETIETIVIESVYLGIEKDELFKIISEFYDKTSSK